LSFVFTLYNAEDVFYFSFLKGLVEYRARGRERALRLVYSPWPIEWETSRASREAVAAFREERPSTP
jgi:hypothetical protein